MPRGRATLFLLLLVSARLLPPAGATIGADAQQLFDFAVMGGAMARAIYDIERPTVGLLNIGVEEVKGLERVREAGQMLRVLEDPEEAQRRLKSLQSRLEEEMADESRTATRQLILFLFVFIVGFVVLHYLEGDDDGGDKREL